MPTTLFKEVTYSLSKLVQDIQMGEIGLPDIQRPFVWKNNRVRDLFDSMFRGFPVGYLLGWVTQVFAVAMGLLTPWMYWLGGMFALLWVVSFVLGRRIEATPSGREPAAH